MKTRKRNMCPIVSTTIWLRTKKDQDLSRISSILGVDGETRRIMDAPQVPKEFARSYWKLNRYAENVISIEEEIKTLLTPLCDKADIIHKLMEKEALKASVTVAIFFDRKKYLPMMVLGEDTIRMMNALRVSEFSIDTFLY